VVFTSTTPGSTRAAIADGSGGPPGAVEIEPDDPEPNGKDPEPNGKDPEPNGKPEEGELADGCEADVERDCQATRPMPNPAAPPITSNATTSKAVGT
jgi:hypothetical protein